MRALGGVLAQVQGVSMESGLEGRNNDRHPDQRATLTCVSMESGLEGRNNTPGSLHPGVYS